MTKSFKSLYALLLLFVVSLVACSDDHSASSSGDEDSTVSFGEDSLTGFIRVQAVNTSTFLGTDDSTFKPFERPRMKVEFDYDFAIGKSEVTCGEFNQIRKKFDFSVECENDSLPATNVTYYDAVLYANSISKSLKMDTAYTYVGANYNSDGNCISLEGFTFHPEVQAIRLPTEAEWVLVASSSWFPKNSWNSGNSKFKKHKVCSKQTNPEDVCDMAGNVMEWVNDWLGSFSDTTITNYVGAPDGGSLGQRILKGGSYRDDPDAMFLHTRGETYTVTSSKKDDYVGFRLAYGAIPNAVWMSGGSASTSRVNPLASSSQIKKIMGTYRTKLVFQNHISGNLSMIDYSTGVPSVVEIKDTLVSFHPTISPDGMKVAFCTKMESVSGKSALYVRDLNAPGSNLVKLDVESAAIPRWKVIDGDTSIVYVTDAGNNENLEDFRKQSTWIVPFSKGKFGTPRKLFAGAYHGGVADDLKFAVGGSTLLRARVTGKDVVWYDEEQACNVSLAKDGSGRTLFLDFGNSQDSNFVGESYGVHERVLMMDSTGELVQSIASPRKYAFDHTEWISDHLVVATMTNVNLLHEKIVIVNTLDSSITEIAEGDELWHPDVWFDESLVGSDETLLDYDSAGVYYTSEMQTYGLELRVKMESYWTKLNTTSAVALGSSRIMFGLDEKKISAEKLVNMGYSSGDFPGMYFLIKNYVLKLPKLKTVVLEFSPDFMIVDVNTSWNPLYTSSPGFHYDENHGFWPKGVSVSFVEAVQNSYKPSDAITLPYTLGEFLLPSAGWGKATVFRDSSTIKKTFSKSIDANVALLREMIDMAKEKDIQVVLLIPPLNPGYKSTGAFGLYGISRSQALELIDTVKSMDVVLMDENKMGSHDYGDDMAYNTDHLSRAGAAQLSGRLDSLLKTLK